jgi:EAL domain-containing protein (putative c-di-GMP-specific phosphodiesterase class I)
VVAEGVETQSQADFLAESGCPLAQGYHFSRPVPPAELRDLLRANTST